MFYYNARRTLELRIEHAIKDMRGSCDHKLERRTCPKCIAEVVIEIIPIED